MSTKKKSISKNNKSSQHKNKNNMSVAVSKGKVADKADFAKTFVKQMLETVHMIKLYHWKTKSYATHKATDGLHGKLGDLVDRYVEVFVGKYDIDLKMNDYSSLTLKNIKDNQELEIFITELISFLLHVHKKLDVEIDVDLFTLRDEIIAELNQFLYLLRLK